MNVHQNARLTPRGRGRIIVRLVESGQPPKAVAEAVGICVARRSSATPRDVVIIDDLGSRRQGTSCHPYRWREIGLSPIEQLGQAQILLRRAAARTAEPICRRIGILINR